MRKESAEKALVYVNNECKSKVEKAIREVLKVRTSLVFSLKKLYNGDYYIDCQDEFDNVKDKMMCNDLLCQLFDDVKLRVMTVVNDDDELPGAFFRIGVEYHHNYDGGSNGHDLMTVAIMDDGSVRIRK